ncbi:uncharacterized protein LOC135210569 [Macrobrachium nipponense]|uniref:uncharacterized protein LOC135210569 n=1 Tax=Macrobrachium nipponense TaxID=159736 RepID=UPI0030C7C9E7
MFAAASSKMKMAGLIPALFLLAGFFPFCVESESSEEIILDSSPTRVNRAPVPPVKIKFNIPYSLPYYSEPISEPYQDECPRDEVSLNGKCYKLLTQGPCNIDEFVVVDRISNTSICRKRFCAPDRILIPNSRGNCDPVPMPSGGYNYTQQNLIECPRCHDRQDPYVCLRGRELFLNMYGEPECQCPTGTYEGGPEPTDVCEPLFGETPSCPKGYVFGLENLNKPPVCLPEPCGGANLMRDLYEFPYVPVSYDKCFQIGAGNEVNGVCPPFSYITLVLDTFRGTCSTLEDAGYQIFDQATLAFFTNFYGPPIERGCTSTIPLPQTQMSVQSESATTIQMFYSHKRKRRQTGGVGTAFDTPLVNCRSGNHYEKCGFRLLSSNVRRNRQPPTRPNP